MKPICVLFIIVMVFYCFDSFAMDSSTADYTIGQEMYRYDYSFVKGKAQPTYVITLKPFADLITLQDPANMDQRNTNDRHRDACIIYFESGSNMLIDSEEKKLYRLLNILNRKQAVNIAGYTSQAGGFEINNRLAWQRAKNVADWFRSHSIKVGQVIGKPKCCYVSDLEPAKNRRVEIVFTTEVKCVR